MIPQLALGLLLSGLIGLVGYWRSSLSTSGVLGALLTGTLIFGLGGIVPGLLLVAFFVSSSLLSHYRASAKAELADKFQKGSRRDFGQALANGGWASLLMVAHTLWPNPVLFVAFVGALAAVTADTWATELGVLSQAAPRLITTGERVPVGASGGVTWPGTLAALAGASFVGAAAAGLVILTFLFNRFTVLSLDTVGFPWRALLLLPAGAVAGLGGALFDSLLGASVQAIYYCDYDRKETERRVHSCGRPTRLLRGRRWLDNDFVNFAASVFGSLAASLVWMLVPGR